MQLYLMRHGTATDPQTDWQCPLSPRGQAEIERLGKFLARIALPITMVYHSEKLRAQQTATTLASSMNLSVPLIKCDELNPGANIVPALELIAAQDTAALFVGHLPTIMELTAALLGVPQHLVFINFLPGTFIALQQMEYGWSITHILSPHILPK